MRRRDLLIGVLSATAALAAPVPAEANPGDDVPITIFEQRDETRYGVWVGAAALCIVDHKPSRWALRTFVLDNEGAAGRDSAAARMRSAVREKLRELRAVALSDEDFERIHSLRYDAR